MSKSTLIKSGIGLLALGAVIAPAAAADLGVRAPVRAPAVVATVYDWTGFYIGAHGGGARARNDASTAAFTIAGFPVAASVTETRPSGWLAGGQIGYNFYQSPTPWWFGGRVVLGVEAQGSWAKMDDTVACSSTIVGGPVLTANCTAEVKALGSVALRYGTAWDRFLLYSKIGAGWSVNEFSIVSTSPLLAASLTGDTVRWGWMSGTGVEIALHGNWSIKGEYNYMSLGRGTVTFTGTPAGATFDSEFKQRIHVVKFGVNYRFGGGPVVARY